MCILNYRNLYIVHSLTFGVHMAKDKRYSVKFGEEIISLVSSHLFPAESIPDFVRSAIYKELDLRKK